MKKCDEILELITPYIDKCLSSEERFLFEEHIESCCWCKNELEEMKLIIRSCADSYNEELPIHFKENLHKKLVECDLKEKRKREVLELRNKYIKIFTSVAACLVIVILLKNFVFTSLPSLYKADMKIRTESINEEAGQSLSNDNVEPSAAYSDAASSYKVEDKSLKENTAAIPSDKVKEKKAEVVEKPKTNVMQAPIQASKQAPNQAPKQVAAENKMQNNEMNTLSTGASDVTNLTIVNKKFNIVVTTESPDKEIEKLKNVISAYDGETKDNVYAAAIMYGNRAESVQDIQNDLKDTVILNIKVSNSQYSEFENKLKTMFQPETISFETLTEDVSNISQEINNRLIELENKISEIETRQSISNPQDLESLKKERDAARQKNEELTMNSEYTMVTIVIKKKQ